MKLINNSNENCDFTPKKKSSRSRLREKTISNIKKNLDFNIVLNISKLSKFLDREIVIYNKFTPPTVHDEYNSEKITSLFINYLEEYYEFLEAKKELLFTLENEALPKTINEFLNHNYEKVFGTRDYKNILKLYQEFLYELIDMICYIGTMTIVYNSKCYDYYNRNLNSDNLSLNINSSPIRSLCTSSEKGIIVNESKNLLDFLFNNLRNETDKIKKIHSDFEVKFISLRRIYPERKWHKVKEPYDTNTEYELIGSKIEELCITTIVKLIQSFILLLIPYLFLDCNSKVKKDMQYNDFVNVIYNEAFNMIYDKQEVTINLENK